MGENEGEDEGQGDGAGERDMTTLEVCRWVRVRARVRGKEEGQGDGAGESQYSGTCNMMSGH